MLPALSRPLIRSAGLAVQRVLALAPAVLHQLEPVGVVAPVLAGDVVALLALLARQGDLRTDVGGCHVSAPSLVPPRRRLPTRCLRTCGRTPGSRGPSGVAVTGLEPVTQRL